jgi:hypothetical protein
VFLPVETFYLLLGAKIIVDPIDLPGPGGTTVVKHKRMQCPPELRVKLGERFGQGALAHARRARKNNKASPLFSCHVLILAP